MNGVLENQMHWRLYISDPISENVTSEELLPQLRRHFGPFSYRVIKVFDKKHDALRVVYAEIEDLNEHIISSRFLSKHINVDGHMITFHPAQQVGFMQRLKPRITLKISYRLNGQTRFVQEFLDNLEANSGSFSVSAIKSSKEFGSISLLVDPKFNLDCFGSLPIFKGIPLNFQFEEEVVHLNDALNYKASNVDLLFVDDEYMRKCRKSLYEIFTTQNSKEKSDKTEVGTVSGIASILLTNVDSDNEQDDSDKLSLISDELEPTESYEKVGSDSHHTIVGLFDENEQKYFFKNFEATLKPNINIPKVLVPNAKSSQKKIKETKEKKGKKLLREITPIAPDIKFLNDFALNSIAEQVQNLVAIKDSLRLEKRQTKLRQKVSSQIQSPKVLLRESQNLYSNERYKGLQNIEYDSPLNEGVYYDQSSRQGMSTYQHDGWYQQDRNWDFNYENPTVNNTVSQKKAPLRTNYSNGIHSYGQQSQCRYWNMYNNY